MFAIASGATYNLVWIVVGVFALLEVLSQGKRFLDRRAVRTDKLDKLIKQTSTNGGGSDDVGDVAKRTENAVAGLTRAFYTFVGETRTIHRDLRNDIDQVTSTAQSALEVAKKALDVTAK